MGIWTNNWQGVKNTMLAGSVIDNFSTIVLTSGTNSSGIRRYPSPLKTLDRKPSNSYSIESNPDSSFGSNNYVAVLFGTGTNALQASDYQLASIAPAGLQQLAVSSEDIVQNTQTHTLSRKSTISLYNSTTTDIQITEWGLFMSGGNGSWTSGATLVYRELLQAPVIIAPSASANFELTVSLTLDNPI